MKGHKLSQLQVVTLHALMAAHCRKGDHGMALYEDGWDDARVLVEARTANPEPAKEITTGMVQKMRRDLFGRVAVGRPIVLNGDDLGTRVAALEEQVALIEKELADLRREFASAPLFKGRTP